LFRLAYSGSVRRTIVLLVENIQPGSRIERQKLQSEDSGSLAADIDDRGVR
jgi:hypothetical protein